jgi:hypothetical protein
MKLRPKKTIQRFNEKKSCFFKNFKKIDKLLANWIRKWGKRLKLIESKKKKEQSQQIPEKSRISLWNTLITYNLRELENLEEMDKLLYIFNQLKFVKKI